MEMFLTAWMFLMVWDSLVEAINWGHVKFDIPKGFRVTLHILAPILAGSTAVSLAETWFSK